jgi:hypothetical protein
MNDHDAQNNNPEADNDNSRNEARILSEVTIFVETYSSPDDEPTPPNIVISKTLDLSANGLQMIMDHPLAEGSILQLCVDFGLKQPRFHLIGEVRWVRKTPDGRHYLTGFQLLDSEGCGIEEWKNSVATLLSDENTRLD